MLVCQSRFVFVALAGVWIAACLSGDARRASGQVLYSENFDDAMLAENAMANANVTIENGFASFNDPADGRATFSVIQNFTDPVMTFSFDVVAPVVQTQDPVRMEVILRAGVGTTHGTLQNADQVVESIIFRGGNRGAYTNNGNETIFLVANNQAAELTFPSPVDGANVTLPGFNYIPFVRNNDTDVFGLIKGVSAYNGGARPLERFGIGSSTTSDVGTFAIDNVLVMSGVSFEQEIGPEPIPGDTDGDMVVELEDFDPIRDNFRKMVSSRSQGDLVRNGVVDLADFKEWKTAFVGGGGSLAGLNLGFLSNVPEPGTLGLVLLAALTTCSIRNSRIRTVGARETARAGGAAESLARYKGDNHGGTFDGGKRQG